MAATLPLVLLFGVLSSTCLGIVPPYYVTNMKTTYYILPLLDYNETDLLPLISEETFVDHYYGTHQHYQNSMANTLKAWRNDYPRSQFAWSPILNVIKKIDSVPEEHRQKVRINVGGFINHCIVFGVLSPNRFSRIREPDGKILRAIERSFITFEMFQKSFKDEAMSLTGSGYVWLVRQSIEENARLEIMTTSNEDSPFSQGRYPLLVLDMWEHAYYKMHVWNRENYIKNWWPLVDWDNVEEMDGFWRTGKLRESDLKQEL